MTAITDDLPARLLHEEHEGWQAVLAGQGGSYYRRSMTRDALMIRPGEVLSREQAAASYNGASALDGYEIHEPAVIRLGEHAGIVVYRAVARRGDEVTESNVSTTYVFDDSNGGWCVAARQETPA